MMRYRCLFLFILFLLVLTSCKKTEVRRVKNIIKQLPDWSLYKVNNSVTIINQLLEYDRDILIKAVKPKRGDRYEEQPDLNNAILCLMLFQPMSNLKWPRIFRFMPYPIFKDETIETFPLIVVDDSPILLTAFATYEGFFITYNWDYYNFIKKTCIVRTHKFQYIKQEEIDNMIQKVEKKIQPYTSDWSVEVREQYKKFLYRQMIDSHKK